MTKTRERLFELDLLRFLAAAAVMFYHYCHRGFLGDDSKSVVRFDELTSLAQYGSYGVPLFFMISGYVILMTAGFRDARGFVISRAVRLFPAFWFSVTLTTVCILALSDGRFAVTLPQYLVNLTMVAGALGVEDVDGVYWTLLVELKFYAYIFLLLLINRVHHVLWFLYLWCAVSALSLGVELRYLLQFLLMPEFAPFFIAGATFYLARREGYDAPKVILLLAALGLAGFGHYTEVAGSVAHHGVRRSPTVVVLLICSFFGIFFLLSRRKLELINKPIMYTFGALTYPLYLIHQNIGYMIFNVTAGLNRWLVLVLVTALMLGAAYAIHRLVELPGGRLLKGLMARVLYRRQALPG